MTVNLRSLLWNAAGLVLFAGIVLGVFWSVLPWGLAPLAPDAMPWFPFGNRTITLEGLLTSGREATPHQIYWLQSQH